MITCLIIVALVLSLHLIVELNLTEEAKEKKKKASLALMLIPYRILLFFFAKVVCLFNPGRYWRSLTEALTTNEGTFESSLQCCVELFVIFTRPGRQPSPLQLLTIS